VPAKRIPNWTENDFGVVDKLQQSPIRSDEPPREAYGASSLLALSNGAARPKAGASFAQFVCGCGSFVIALTE
jgi:hypothetical protein